MHTRNMTSSRARRCDMSRSWGRHLRDFLVRYLGSAAPHVEVSYKNAVAAAYFERCLSSRVPADTDIVLMEVLSNRCAVSECEFQ